MAVELITNEFATKNPSHPQAHLSDTWVVTSGSLFRRDGVLWTGRPDQGAPGPDSVPFTNSSVFRAVTRRADLEDVDVAFRWRNLGWAPVGAADTWHGLHVFLRYRSTNHNYTASVFRRDGQAVVKKEYFGQYTTLAKTSGPPPAPGAWNAWRVTAETAAAGVVVIRMYQGSRLVLEARDPGVGGSPALTGPGQVGLRADFLEAEFDAFQASPPFAPVIDPAPPTDPVPDSPTDVVPPDDDESLWSRLFGPRQPPD